MGYKSTVKIDVENLGEGKLDAKFQLEGDTSAILTALETLVARIFVGNLPKNKHDGCLVQFISAIKNKIDETGGNENE